MGYKIIQHTDGTVQIEFSPVSKYSFTPYFLSPRPSTSNTSLNSVDFTPKYLFLFIYNKNILLCLLLILMCIILKSILFNKKNYKKTHFTLNVEWIKLYYFSPYNKPRRAYFQTFPPQVRNALRKQYEKYMNQKKNDYSIFSIGFSNLERNESNL